MKRFRVHLAAADLAANARFYAAVFGVPPAVRRAELAARRQPDAACRYARSGRHRMTDPQGIAWETFDALGDIPVFDARTGKTAGAACCAPRQAVAFKQRPARAAADGGRG